MITINPYKDVCVTIKANYYKVSLANFIRGGREQHQGLSNVRCKEI